MIPRISRFALIVVLSAVVAAGPARAADDPTLIGTFGAWKAYSLTESDGTKVCYMASQPTKDEGKYSRRGDIFALITHRPSEDSRNVFSYVTGYDYKADSEATLTVDGKAFGLFTQGDTAWARDSETDNKIAEALRKGSKMVVKGTSSRGTLTTDTFSLSGSGAAHDAINKACGL
jgi:hypothetical protein